MTFFRVLLLLSSLLAITDGLLHSKVIIEECSTLTQHTCVIEDQRNGFENISFHLIQTSSIRKLSIVNCNFRSISFESSPSSSSSNFGSLEWLEAVHSSIKVLHTDIASSTLQHFTFVESGIETVLGTFDGCNSIHKINLSLNLIESLHANLFHQLHHLQVLDLSGNRLKFIPSNLLIHASALELLNMSNNRIETLNPLLLKGNRNLTVNLNNNELSVLNITSDTIFSRIQFFDLYAANNRLKELAITNLSVSILDLSRNQIKSVKFLCESNFQRLNFLDLHQNQINRVGCIKLLNHLFEVNLAENDFKELEIKKITHPRGSYFVICHGRRSFKLNEDRLLDFLEHKKVHAKVAKSGASKPSSWFQCC